VSAQAAGAGFFWPRSSLGGMKDVHRPTSGGTPGEVGSTGAQDDQAANLAAGPALNGPSLVVELSQVRVYTGVPDAGDNARWHHF
jgi:hypothetical protein